MQYVDSKDPVESGKESKIPWETSNVLSAALNSEIYTHRMSPKNSFL